MKQLLFTAWLMISVLTLSAQSKYHATNTHIKMEGTSTFHDWHMISEEGVTNAMFAFNGSNLSSMPSLNFSIPVQTLKSGTKGLNKNAYSALSSEQHPSITFSSSGASITSTGTNSYSLATKGILTIAGAQKPILISANCKINPADMTIAVDGSFKIKMTEYSIKPPSFMFGAMKTGDEVTISFTTTLVK